VQQATWTISGFDDLVNRDYTATKFCLYIIYHQFGKYKLKAKGHQPKYHTMYPTMIMKVNKLNKEKES